MNDLNQLYEQDYTLWAQKNAELLKYQRFNEIDLAHLIEELEDMGKSDQRELLNRLRVLLTHLLKWQYQLKQLSDTWQEFSGKSWRSTIIEQRTSILILLRKHPSLKSFVDTAISEAYPEAVELAVDETDLPATRFPVTCPYSLQQLLDKSFYPT